MSFFGLDITLFDTLIIVNVLAVFFTFIIGIQAWRGMRQEDEQELTLQLREWQKRRHKESQDRLDDAPLVIMYPFFGKHSNVVSIKKFLFFGKLNY